MGRSRDLEDREDVLHALEKISSERNRLAGLVELRSIIQDNRQSQSSGLKQVNDKGYHAILEPVFRVAKSEIFAYPRASKTAKIKLGDRLSACASLVRTVVEMGLSKLRYRTLKAILDHITQSLPTADGGYCEPLILDYLRALATLLSSKAHLEHLSSEDWSEILGFCITVADDLNSTLEEDHDLIRSFGNRGSRSATPSTSLGKHAIQRSAYPRLQRSSEDICVCLQHLVSVPSAPVLDKAEVLSTTLLTSLRAFPHLSKIQQVVLETINSVLSRVVTTDTSLSLQIMTALLPLIRVCWELPKPSQNLKETLLSSLLLGEDLLARMLLPSETDNCKFDCLALAEVLREQYCSRVSRSQLSLDDVEMNGRRLDARRRPPLSLKMMSLRLGVLKAEEPWCLVHISAALLVALVGEAKDGADAHNLDEVRHPRKRQKLAEPLDELFAHARGTKTSERYYALQTLTFIFDMHDFNPAGLFAYLELLMPGLSDDDGIVASWTMLVMAR